MNQMRILVVAILGTAAVPGYAVPVRFTLEGESFTAWEYAQQDLLLSEVTSFEVQDADSDGIALFVAEVLPGDTSAAIHIKSGLAECNFSFLLSDGAVRSGSTFQFVQNVTGDSLIVEMLSAPTGALSLGQPANVTNGMIAGLDGLVHVSPGITIAADCWQSMFQAVTAI